MSNVPARRTAFSVDSVNSKINYAQQLSTAGMLPAAFQRNPGNVLWAIELGESLGIPAITAITGIHVMNGKPTASAGLISALVRKAGHKLRVSGDEKSATATIIRADDPDYAFTVTWTLAMARDAGLMGNATWKKFPASMLKARAITQVARDACQEALNGVQYTPEELGAAVELDEAGEQIVIEQVPGAHRPAPAPVEDTTVFVGQAKRAVLNALGGDVEAAATLWGESGLPGDNNARIEKTDAQVVLDRATATAAAADAEPVDAEVVEDGAGDAPAGRVLDGSGLPPVNVSGHTPPPAGEDPFAMGGEAA